MTNIPDLTSQQRRLLESEPAVEALIVAIANVVVGKSPGVAALALTTVQARMIAACASSDAYAEEMIKVTAQSLAAQARILRLTRGSHEGPKQ